MLYSYSKGKDEVRPFLRRIIWINIFIQFTFPILCVFTPAIASSVVPNQQELSAANIQPYTLKEGETIYSVAKKYGISPEQLSKVNEFRIFSHGFYHLRSGDELDVPKTSVLTPLPDKIQEVSNSHEKKFASLASQGGRFLTNSPNSESVAAMVKSTATGALNTEVQKWLSQFGTARVELGVGKNLSLENSQFDLLLPLYDKGDTLLFAQDSFHRTDHRTQANMGIGARHFYDKWMFGANAFVDYDLSRNLSRAGGGIELGRDFMKFGFNGYSRLTGWHDSPDIEDYQERPANGWDVRLQMWLPALPQLGGKLLYEQYYGNEVALFSINNRQHNPHAITVGVNYTPVPLVTFGVEQRQGESSNQDTQFKIDMKYQFGVPWRNQLSPESVAIMHKLAGSRYDLVERNNNIVLEYRKKETIKLYTFSEVTGYSNEHKSLGVSVVSKHGLSHIDWDAAGFINAGGKIVKNGTDYTLILPNRQSSGEDSNVWTIKGVAEDLNGNRSNESQTQVTLLAPNINKNYSSFTPAKSSLLADGKSTQILTLTLKDKNNQIVDVNEANISLAKSGIKSASVSALTRKSAGVYVVVVTAGTNDETVTLTPSIQDTVLSSAVVTITAGNATQASSAIGTDRTTYRTGDSVNVTVTLRDTGGNPVTGQAASLTAETVKVPNTEAGSAWQDHGDGTYSAAYTAQTAGTGLTASLQLSGWGGSVGSPAYVITAYGLKDIVVNSHTFSPDIHFPTTGFSGASFAFEITGGEAADLTWRSDTSWVSVSAGAVKFDETGSSGLGKTVTITAENANGVKVIEYSFVIKHWYSESASNGVPFDEATSQCASPSVLPTIAEMSTETRTIGALVDEWGALDAYTAFGGDIYWSSTASDTVGRHKTMVSDGRITEDADRMHLYVLCFR